MPVTRVLSLERHGVDEVVSEVKRVLLSGGLAVLPTETVYGVAALATIRSAVRKVFLVKERPPEPLTIHFARLEDVESFVLDLEPLERAWRRAWPGPLTLIVRASTEVPRVVTAGLPCVGLRAPAHPLTLRVLAEAGPVVMPSANISGRPSPFTPLDAMAEMFGRVEILVDAGPCVEGLESTVVDLCRSPPKVLRLGPLSLEEIEAILGRPLEVSKRALGIDARARYRISKPLILVDGDPAEPRYVERVSSVARELASKGMKVAVLCRSSHAPAYRELGLEVIELGESELDAARNLFPALRTAERIPVDIVVAESWGSRGLGLAITSRLRNAATRIV